MEHLTAPEERVAQPSQKVVNQAVQSQSPQSQVGRLQDMSQPQVWTTQTLLSLQHNSPSSSPEAKVMESHSAEEATQQRTEMASMEHLTMPSAMSPHNTGNATGNDTETGNDTGTHVSADAAATGGSSGGIYETKQSQIAAEDDASSTVLCDGSRADHICGRTETSSRSG